MTMDERQPWIDDDLAWKTPWIEDDLRVAKTSNYSEQPEFGASEISYFR